MSEHHQDELTAALHRLRAAVREQVPVPASAAVRAAATRQLRVRRTAIGAFAAAAVAAIALGGAAVLPPSAAPDPMPPAESPGPTAEPPATPTPVPDTRRVPPADPAATPPEPFTDLDWRQATIDVPPQDGCPSGAVTFVAVSDIYLNAAGPADDYPQILLNANGAAYGDLTGDGRAEAVVKATCARDEEDSLDGEGQLLVVSRDPGGDLRGIAWVGPRGAIYQSAWVADGALYVEAHPWHGEGFEWALGVALRYEWDGDGFGSYRWAPEYPPILPADEAQTGPPVTLGPVAAGLGCPDGTVRFGRDGTAAVGRASYDITQPSLPSSGPHLIDLDQTGERRLVLVIRCTRGGETAHGLGVFEPSADGFRGVSVLIPPVPAQISAWSSEPQLTAEQIVISFEIGEGGPVRDSPHRWMGTEFVPVG